MPACAISTRSDPPPAIENAPLTLSQLDVTLGQVNQVRPGHFHITEPKVRAVSAVPAGDAAELRFTYRGSTAVEIPLADGEHRRQVGLKLRAEDGCNVVYVMWRIEPEAKLVVSLKRNPGVHTDAACGTNGYTTVAPEWSADAPLLHSGDHHALAASIEDGTLLVRIDGRVVWQGLLGEDALGLHGNVGLRTDNADIDDVELVPIPRTSIVPTMLPPRGTVPTSPPPGSSP